MKRIVFILFYFVFFITTAQNLYPTLHDQSGGIIDGYGSWGAYNTIQETSIDIVGKGTITFYHPDIPPTQLGTLFFISGWGRDAATYNAFFHFLASHGYSVTHIYNTNPGTIENSYPNALNMILDTASLYYPDWVDITKIGLMGHSFGAGATIWVGKELFGTTHNWGINGRFIFMTAPWLSFLIDKDDLQNYPSDVKLLVEIGNDDQTNDPNYTWNTDERAVRAVYELINIPNDEKDFIRVMSNPTTFEYNGETYSYEANHYISYTGAIDASYGYFRTYDAMDVYAINRLSHALIDYVFEGNTIGKEVALGNGSASQTNMGFLTDLIVTDAPIITRPENEFLYRCSETIGWGNPDIWKLQDYCNDSDNDGVIDYLVIDDLQKASFKLYPVPSTKLLNIRFNNELESLKKVEIKDVTGKTVYLKESPNSYSIDISSLATGTYFINIVTKHADSTQKIIVK